MFRCDAPFCLKGLLVLEDFLALNTKPFDEVMEGLTYVLYCKSKVVIIIHDALARQEIKWQ